MNRSWVRAGFGALACALVLGAGSTAQAADKSAPAGAAAAPSGDVVASAGGATVPASEIQKFLKSLPPQDRAALAANPAKLKDLVIKQLAQNLLIKEAKSKKLEDKPEVAKEIEAQKNQIIVAAYLANAVPASSVPEPTDAELKPIYDKTKDNPQLMAPRSIRLAHLFLAVQQGADQATEDRVHQKIVDLARQAKAKPGDFAQLAKANSEDPNTAQKGGEVDPIPEDQLAAPIRQAIAALNRGDVSEPIRTPGGWDFFKLIDIKPAAVRSYDELKGYLANRVRESRLEQAKEQYVLGLMQKGNLQVNDAALSKMLADATQGQPAAAPQAQAPAPAAPAPAPAAPAQH